MSIKDKNLEDLIAIAKTETKSKPKKAYLNEAHRFVVSHGLEAGEHKVRPFVIYDKYKQWKDKKNIQKKPAFFKDFARIFDRKIDSTNSYYMLNRTLLEVEDGVEEENT